MDFRALYDYLLIALVMLGPGVLVAVVDLKTRRGFALIVVGLLAAASEIYGLWIWPRSAGAAYDNSIGAGLDVGLGVVVMLMLGLALTLSAFVPAMVMAARARQRRWLVGLLASLLPLPLFAVNEIAFARADAGHAVGPVLALLALACPLLACLAYGIWRTVHPSAPVRATARA